MGYSARRPRDQLHIFRRGLEGKEEKKGGAAHTHLDVEPDGLGQLHEHLLESREGRLDEVATAVGLVSLHLEIPRMLHALRYVQVLLGFGFANRVRERTRSENVVRLADIWVIRA